MKAALPLLVLGLAVFLYIDHRDSHHSALPGYTQSKYEEPAADEQAGAAQAVKNDLMTARDLEDMLQSQSAGKVSCRKDRSGNWTYICREGGRRWGYQVAGTVLLRSAPLR